MKTTDLKQNELDTTLSDRAIAAGLRRHFHFDVVGYGPVPLEPYHQGFYYIEPVSVPPRGLNKITCLRENDIPILGYVVIHEPKVTEEKKEEVPDFKIKPIVPAGDISGEDVLKVVAGVLGALAVGMGMMLMIAIQADPILICILDDPQKTWLRIETWYD
jgi:hypothetical protein